MPSAIRGAAEPAELVQALQPTMAASQRRKVIRAGEVANALSKLIIDAAVLHFFAVDQDTPAVWTLITNGLLAQNGVVFDKLFGIVTRSTTADSDDDPDDDDGSDGEMPDSERDGAEVPPVQSFVFPRLCTLG
jgi:hypothetical protein